MVLLCRRIGISGEKIHIQEIDGKYEARQALAIFGNFPMSEAELEKIDYNPFHNDFIGEYALGKGETTDKAIAAMEENFSVIEKSLWL